MAPSKKVTKILIALFDAGGELTRKEIVDHVFRRNIRASALDALLASPELAGLIGKTRARRPALPGTRFVRRAVRYYLTVEGWTVLVRGLKRGVKPLRLNREAVRSHFERLLAEGDLWAAQIQRDAQDAAKWRTHIATLQAERRAAKNAASAAPRVQGSQAAILPEQRRATPVPKADANGADDWSAFRSAIGLGSQSR